MKTSLRRLVYNIDQDNTLNIVTGGGRPETVSVTALGTSYLWPVTDVSFF